MHGTFDDLQKPLPANEHSRCLHTATYANNDEDGVPQGQTCTRTIASHSYVPSCAKNTQKGLQCPTEHHTGKGRGAVISHITSTSHSKERPEKSNTATHDKQVICYQAHHAEAHTHTHTHTHTRTHTHTLAE